MNLSLKELLKLSKGHAWEKRVKAAIEAFGPQRVVFDSPGLTFSEFKGAHYTKGYSKSFCMAVATDMNRCYRRILDAQNHRKGEGEGSSPP